MKLFHVRSGTRHVIVNIPEGMIGDEREYVKREARRFLFGNPDYYTVDPITAHGDVVFMSLAIGDMRP
jgi:hypothetical protein